LTRLCDVDASTEDAFLRCLHLEVPAEPEVMALRRRWVDRHRTAGLRAKVLVDENGTVLAMGQYVPIGISPFVGEGLAVILCMWVHGYDHHIGNVQGRGHGTRLLAGMEHEIREAGFAGIAAWGMDFPYWNPVSWYEYQGYERVDRRGPEVLVWKPLEDAALPPRFLRPSGEIDVDPWRPTVTVYVNGWCTGACGCACEARRAARQLGDEVVYREIDVDAKADLLLHDRDGGVYLDGRAYRAHEPPWTAETLVQDARRRREERRPS